MKPNFQLRSFLAGSALFAMIGAAQAQHYWDSNNGTAGFGTATGTWAAPTTGTTTSGWTTSSTGVTAIDGNSVTTTTGGAVNFGTSTNGLASGTITISGGEVAASGITFGSASGAITLDTISGGKLVVGSGGISANSTGHIIDSDIRIPGATNSTLTISVGTEASGGTLTIGGKITNNVGINNNLTLRSSNSTAAQIQTIVLNGQSTYTGSTTFTGTSSTSQLTVKAGVDDALATTTVLSLQGGVGTGTGRTIQYDLNGHSQTLGGLTNTAASLRNQYIVNTSGTAGALVIDDSSNRTFSGNLGNPNGTQANFSLTKGGIGSWTLGGANTFTGSTTITGGLLILTNADALQNSYINTTATTTSTVNNGLRTSGSSLKIGGLFGNKDFANILETDATFVSSLTLNTVAANDLSYSGEIGGARSLTKTGAGTQTFTGTNTYTGTTTVSAGVLAVNGSLANTTTTVGSTGTLQGSGTIGGSVTIQSGGTLAPGNSIESLGTGALSFLTGSTYDYELQTNLYAGTPNVAGDLTYTTSTLDIASGAILTLTDLATSTALAAGSKLTLISYGSGWTSTELFTYLGNTLNDDSTFTLGANQWLFNYNDTVEGLNFAADSPNGQSYVTMTVVIPEPRAALLGGLGLLALLRRRRD